MNTYPDLIDQIIVLQEETKQDYASTIYKLEYMVQLYYQSLYPSFHGSFFIPLTPTIGYTHCHYLDMSKFGGYGENKYWIKCNLMTNEIEELPEQLQPQNISQMIHTLHQLARIKNTYHEKHIAPLHFSNKEDVIRGGKFLFIQSHKRLVYDRESTQKDDYYTSGPKHSDIVINNRQDFENLTNDFDALLLYLNTWNNQALLELTRSRVLLPDFVSWLKHHPVSLFIDGKEEILENEWSNAHFTNGILGVHELYGESWDRCVKEYQRYLDLYMQQNDYFDQVFFVGNGMLDHDVAFIHYNHDLYKVLQWRYKEKCRFFVPHPHGPQDQPITSPDMILLQLREYIVNNPDHKVLFSLGLHGLQDGSASYIGGSFYKHHFELLFDLVTLYPSLQVLIMSCRSGMKTDKLEGNIIMSSSQQVSYAAYSKLFVDQLYTGKTIYEAHVKTMLEYHESLLPTSFYDAESVSRELCPLLQDPSTHQELSINK